MIDPSSERPMTGRTERDSVSTSPDSIAGRPRRFGRLSRKSVLGNRRGSVVMFVSLSLVAFLGAAGLALDAGNGYIARVRLSRAVDAGALAAVRSLRQGQQASRLEAEAVARANRIGPEFGQISTDLAFGTNDRGESTVIFSATQSVPTVFVRLLGIDHMQVSAAAEAAAPPLDVILVLDTSGSLGQNNAWVPLQGAAKSFVTNLSESIDRMSLIQFQLAARKHFALQHNFRSITNTKVDGMISIGDTNIQEGLRLAREEMAANGRPSAAKVVVFFTDGRPTAMRGFFGGVDRLTGVYSGGTMMRGYFNNPESLANGNAMWADNIYPGSGGISGGCRDRTSACSPLPRPSTLLDNIEAAGLAQANLLREDGILVYSIGLGNMALPANDPALPDLNYLRKVANEGGISNSNQPRGKMYFAPSPDDLNRVFLEVANDLVVRLSR